MRTMTTIVPNGSAAVALYTIATVLRKQNVRNRGPQKRNPVKSTFLTCTYNKGEMYNPAIYIFHKSTFHKRGIYILMNMCIACSEAWIKSAQ